MNARPRLSLLLLSAAWIVGLVGLMVLDWPYELPLFLLALLPVALGIAGWIRARSPR